MSEPRPDEKRELLARLLRQRSARPASGDELRPVTVAEAPEIVVVPRTGDLPLSFGQERVWFLEQLQPESLFYNVIERFRFQGALDVDALRRSAELLQARHEAMRTTFPTVEGQPVQRIAPPGPWSLPLVDLRGLDDPAREAEGRRLMTALAKKPFDLATGPLLRTTLYRMADNEYVLAVAVHHIVIDGWSMMHFLRELLACYEALSSGRVPSLPTLSVQYADYAVWQRKWLGGTALEESRAYWKRALGHRPPVLDLPTDRPRPAQRTFEGRNHNAVVPPALLGALRELSRAEGVTLFTTLLTGFAALLMRYSGQDDFVIGTLVNGRERPQLENVLGFFVNTLALRIDLSDDPTVRDALQRVRETVVGAHAHGSLPFEQLVEEIQPGRTLSGNPLAQVFLNMLNYGLREDSALPGLCVTPLSGVDLHTVADQITLFVTEGSGQLALGFTYSTELFDEATVVRLAEHLGILLNGMVASPSLRLSELPLLTEAERTALERRATPAARLDVPRGALHRRFEEQAAARPDAVALRCEGAQLTYRELDEHADSLARRLRTLGVGPDVVVGLCAGRSLELVVGMLGILKAGGAYLPLDPTYPPERLAFMLADSGASVVLAARSARAALPTAAVEVVEIEETLAGSEPQPPEPAPTRASCPGDLAYVIYTSGSTGTPKGVLVTHANVLRLLDATDPWFRFSADDIWTLFHSFAFDFSVWELWGALAYGGRLVVVPYAISRDPVSFREMLLRERVTVLNQTPSAFRQLIDADRMAPAALGRDLRVVIFGGEALDPHSLAWWIERYGDEHPRLVNMYGITETCVHVTYRPITRADLEAGKGSVIGVPIPDLTVRLLDRHGRLVPFGVPGEIHVGGPGLARGYLNRPELTAERFVPDPLLPGERLYRSGDMARWLGDGDLEYLGRADDQVKIRGFRVEPGEIEATLARHPAVRMAAVLIRKDGGVERLVAYVVPEAGVASLAVEALRAHVQESLPAYMVPDFFVELAALPITANGKLDRSALPPPAQEPVDRSDAPGNQTEAAIAEIWSDVLGRPCGIHSDFFALGGHSLLATQVQARLHARLGVRVPVRTLFEAPTIARLAERVDALLRAQESAREEITL
jgi:amino acid adenylation domain-containing protein